MKLTDETNRTWLSIIDDSRMRLADDLDIAPDGRIFFSEATIRFDMYEWMVDGLEARGNGRIICYDPRDKSTRTVIPGIKFANGICLAHDGKSLFYASTWGCTIARYWLEGPKKGPDGDSDRRPSRAIPTISIALPTAITGLPSSACARRPSTSRCASPASAGAWCSALRRMNGCFRR